MAPPTGKKLYTSEIVQFCPVSIQQLVGPEVAPGILKSQSRKPDVDFQIKFTGCFKSYSFASCSIMVGIQAIYTTKVSSKIFFQQSSPIGHYNSKKTENYLTNIYLLESLVIKLPYINGTTTIMLALKIALNFVWKLPLGLWDYESSMADELVLLTDLL